MYRQPPQPPHSVQRATTHHHDHTLAMSQSYNSDTLREALRHSRHNSYDSNHASATPTSRIDQTFAPHLVKRSPVAVATAATASAAAAASNSNKVRSKSANVTPATIKRSSSFSTKPFGRPQSGPAKAQTPKLAQRSAFNAQPTTAGGGPLQKSASSASFKNMAAGGGGLRYGCTGADIYLNDNDDLYARNFGSESESELSDLASPQHRPNGGASVAASNASELITNTRYNKAFLARLEQNKPKGCSSGGAGGQAGQSAAHSTAGGQAAAAKQGVIACPNTPEMPRRDLRVRQSLRDRASMPRDTSMTRMKQDLGAGRTLASAKRGLLETPAAVNRGAVVVAAAAAAAAVAPAPGTPTASRVQPKYLDISKYKPQQGNTFLRRDESKSTLNPQHKEIKRSASSFGVGLSGRAEAGRSSVRSVKSATSSSHAGGGRPAMSASKGEFGLAAVG